MNVKPVEALRMGDHIDVAQYQSQSAGDPVEGVLEHVLDNRLHEVMGITSNNYIDKVQQFVLYFNDTDNVVVPVGYEFATYDIGGYSE